MNNQLRLSRRQVVGAGLAAVASIGAGLTGSARASISPGTNEIYARARGGAGDNPGLWLYWGRLWGKPVNDQATNLFAIEGVSFNRMVRKPDGQLQQIMEECGFWKDPDSKQILDDWINPLNGLPCTARHYRSRQELTFLPNGEVIEGSVFRGRITDATISGKTLWISESLHGAFASSRTPDQDPLTYTGPVRTATSLVTYTLNADEVTAEDAGYVACTMNYQSMSSWYPWMRMGQAQGQIMFELFGRKLASTDEIPSDLRAVLDQRRAGFLDNPNV